MYTIKKHWNIAHNIDGTEAGGYMIYHVYRDGRFQSAHLSAEAASAWVSAYSHNADAMSATPYRRRGGCIT